MFRKKIPSWKKNTVSTDAVLRKIEPGMHIFIGTGTAEPRTLVNALMTAEGYRLFSCSVRGCHFIQSPGIQTLPAQNFFFWLGIGGSYYRRPGG